MEVSLDDEPPCQDVEEESVSQASVLLVEPFYGGSHKQLIDLLAGETPGCLLCCLPAKKWHWRMRTSALYLSQKIPYGKNYKVLFASSILNLAELVALRPDLVPMKKVLYFHENQLVYPVRKQQDRDFQYGYNQILSCLVADVVVFNSHFNMESFLSSINSFLKLMPDYRPQGLNEIIRPKCRVVYFPLMPPDQLCEASSANDLHEQEDDLKQKNSLSDTSVKKISCVKMNVSPVSHSELSRPLHIVWAHRWLEAVQYGCYPLCPNKLVYPEIFSSPYLFSTPQQLVKKLRYFCRNPQHARKHRIMVDWRKFSWDRLKQEFYELLSPVETKWCET